MRLLGQWWCPLLLVTLREPLPSSTGMSQQLRTFHVAESPQPAYRPRRTVAQFVRPKHRKELRHQTLVALGTQPPQYIGPQSPLAVYPLLLQLRQF